ncbi:MAG: NAD-binding protein, partial [Flammeovirgaceae bacterium]|nr:NAD-binding protein [Flammeovirgaceae bacterium]
MRRFVQSQSMLIVFGIIAVFVFGFWGYLDSEVLKNLVEDEELHYKEKYHFLNSLYAILGMFLMAGLEPNIQNWQIAVASYLAAGVLGYGILNIIWNYAYDAIASVWIMIFYRDHTIIVGNSGIGYRIAIELLKSGSKVVTIDKQLNFDENTTKIRSLGGFVLARSGSESNDFIKAGIARAGHCLVLNSNEEENLQSINILSWLNQRKKIINGPLKVLVNVEDWNNKFFLKDYMDLYNTTENFDIDAF